MTHHDHTVTRRGMMKRSLVAVPTIQQLGTADNPTDIDPDDVLLTARDIPDSFESGTANPEDSKFLQALRDVDPATACGDIDARAFLRYDDGRLAAGIASTAIVYEEGAPRARTVERITTQTLDGFDEELAPRAKTDTTVRTDAEGVEWRIFIPDPPWDLDDAYLDVTRVQIVGQAILGMAVYGPASDHPAPLPSARAYSSLMRRRARSGGEES